MKYKRTFDAIFLIVLFIFSAFYLLGVRDVPFHPDESTQIFMSEDVQIFIQKPSGLFWSENNEGTTRQEYRELDAPLTRTILGTGRLILTLPATKNDWDWSKSWQENSANGALPGNKLLFFCRLFTALLFPVSLFLIYHIGEYIAGQPAGLLSAFLMALNPLLLLHTRRAMAESALVLTMLLSLYMMIKTPKRVWLIAIPIALAFNAKQSAISLLFVGLFVVGWHPKKEHIKISFYALSLFLVLFCFVTFAFNPFLWSNPINGLLSAIQSRQELATAQIDTFGSLNPNLILNSPQNRIISLIAQVFFTPPQTAETSNYIDELKPSIESYFTNFLNSLFSTVILQVLFCILSLGGLIWCIVKLISNFQNESSIFLLLITFAATIFTIYFFIPLSFQRYYLPLIPLLCLFSAIALTDALKNIRMVVIANTQKRVQQGS